MQVEEQGISLWSRSWGLFVRHREQVAIFKLRNAVFCSASRRKAASQPCLTPSLTALGCGSAGEGAGGLWGLFNPWGWAELATTCGVETCHRSELEDVVAPSPLFTPAWESEGQACPELCTCPG